MENGEPRSIRKLEDDLERFLASGDLQSCCRLTLELADAYRKAGRNHDALETLRMATESWDLNEFPRLHAEICAAESTLLHYIMREPAIAVPAYREAIDTFTGLDDRKRVADMTYNLGDAYCAIGRFDHAATALQQCVHSFQELGRWADEGDARIALAVALKCAGSEEPANQQINVAGKLAERVGAPLRGVRYLTGLGAELEDLDPDDALWATQRAIPLARPRLRDDDDLMDLVDSLSTFGRLSATPVRILSGDDTVPVALPARIYLGDGRAALGSFADLAMDRYGIRVFADGKATGSTEAEL